MLRAIEWLGLAVLLAVGLRMSVRSGFFQLRGAPFILKSTLGGLLRPGSRRPGGVSPFQAVSAALAGTMGVGNIAGVATALVAGGPGAIFWMWVSAFLGMMTKYAEIFLAVKYRRTDGQGRFYGGAMLYMADGLGKKRLAGLFALLCVLCSLGIGNMAQAHSAAQAMAQGFGVPPLLVGLALAGLVALVVWGGVGRIVGVTQWVIPLLSALYLLAAGLFLYWHRAALPAAFGAIFKGAFALRPAAGGLLGLGAARAARVGLARGVFTNEAGLGSAPIIHASADCQSPAHQAAWGIVEVFLDTVVVCTVTALVLLCADGGRLWQSGLDGAPLTSAAFETAFPGMGAGIIAVSILFYAFAAMLSWYFYGESALSWLFEDRRTPRLGYRVLFIACLLLASVSRIQVVWGLSDLLNGLMALPNCLALWLLSKKITFPGRRPIPRTSLQKARFPLE